MKESAPSARDTSRSGSHRHIDLFNLGNLSAALLIIVPFFLLPLVAMVLYSFATQDYLTAKISFGWTVSAWTSLNDPILIKSFYRSAILAFAAMFGCVLIGYPLAYFVARHAGRFRNLALLLIIVPFWVSFIVRAYASLDILGPAGPINRLLLDSGIRDAPLPLVYNNVGIVIGIIYGYLPLMVFPLYVALERIDPAVLESARDLGASAFSTFRRVTFPQALPGLVAGCILVWIPALGEYVIPTVLGGGKTYMIGNVIAADFGQFQWPQGAALAVAMMLSALAALALTLKAVGRERLGTSVRYGAQGL